MQISICGGGNAAHTLAGLLAAQGELKVNVYAPFDREAERWRQRMSEQGVTVTTPLGSTEGCPERVSAEASEVIPGSNIILLALPAFGHEAMLKQIAPYIPEGAWVGAMPARGFFDLCAQDVLEQKADAVTLFGLQTLPWACRIVEYGQKVNVMGVKEHVDLASCPVNEAEQISALLGDLLDLHLKPMTGFLSLTLAGTGQLIHPGIMYGLFHDWQGETLIEAPPFYQGVDLETAEILEQLSAEIQTLRTSLEERFPGLDISAVRPLQEWLSRSYNSDIEDTATLQSCFVTNRSYAGLLAPVKSHNGGFVPDFQSRYLAEDVPYALIATRGVSELAEVPTPVMDRVIYWAQDRLGKEYLVNGSLKGGDVKESRAPQRYGFNDIDQLVSPCINGPAA